MSSSSVLRARADGRAGNGSRIGRRGGRGGAIDPSPAEPEDVLPTWTIGTASGITVEDEQEPTLVFPDGRPIPATARSMGFRIR